MLFIPMALVILILFDLMFTYKNPGDRAITFFRSIFAVFFGTLLITGAIVTLVSATAYTDVDDSLSIWAGSTEFILALFFGLPARALLRMVTYPLVQPEDVMCVNFCKVGIAAFTILFLGRAVWNTTHFFGINVVQTWMYDHYGDPNKMGRIRAIQTGFIFLFDLVPSMLALAAVFLFKKHDMMFNENPYYRSQEDERY
jgi:hypothetical protein